LPPLRFGNIEVVWTTSIIFSFTDFFLSSQSNSHSGLKKVKWNENGVRGDSPLIAQRLVEVASVSNHREAISRGARGRQEKGKLRLHRIGMVMDDWNCLDLTCTKRQRRALHKMLAYLEQRLVLLDRDDASDLIAALLPPVAKLKATESKINKRSEAVSRGSSPLNEADAEPSD
jgi:hypothetical protein